MISVKYSEIPGFLCNGSFFRSLGEEENDEEIQIPEQCYTLDDTVNNVDDCRRMFGVAAFWGLEVIPRELIKFCSTVDRTSVTELIGEEYFAMDFAQDLLKIFAPTLTAKSNDPLVNAITIGRSEVVAYLVAISMGSVEAAATAAERGRLDFLKLLHQHGHPWDFTACDAAATRGHLECLVYLHENGCQWYSTAILHAAKNGHFHCLKYAHEQGLKWHPETTSALAGSGNLEMLQYAVKNDCPLGSYPTQFAASNGHAGCLKYLIEQGSPVDDYLTLEGAIKGGHLSCLKVLLDLGSVRLDADLIASASFWGHLHIIQYLHEKGCRWDWQVPKMAAYRGHFDVLYYAVENNCECTACTILDTVRTVEANALESLQYLVKRGHAVPQNGTLLVAAFACGNYLAIDYLFTEQPSATVISEETRLAWSVHLNHSFCDNPDFDNGLSKCITWAMKYDFDIRTDAPELVEFINANVQKLPLSMALLY